MSHQNIKTVPISLSILEIFFWFCYILVTNSSHLKKLWDFDSKRKLNCDFFSGLHFICEINHKTTSQCRKKLPIFFYHFTPGEKKYYVIFKPHFLWKCPFARAWKFHNNLFISGVIEYTASPSIIEATFNY